MNRFLIAVAVVAVTAAGIAVATGSAQAPSGRTLTLFEDVLRESSTLVDNAPRSPAKSPENRRFRLSAGDELVGRTPLLERSGGGRIGTSYVRGAVVRGRSFEDATLQADVVLALRDGTIVLAGLAGTAQRPFAVVGGTGAYEGADGFATEKETSGGAVLTVRLLP
jgi:hypothetical protein